MTSSLIKIISGFILLIIGMSSDEYSKIRLIAFILGYLVLGLEVLIKAIKNIFVGKVFDENLLMSIATIGAFVLGEYPEGVAVMLFYQIGEIFEHYAENKSKKSIQSLLNIRPDYANLLVDGKPMKVSPEKVKIGDSILIKPGEKCPLDSVVTDGNSSVDMSVLTGESIPKNIVPGDKILSGCINLSGTLIVKVEKEFGESTVSKILDLVQNASSQKAQTENFITRFSRYYTPTVICIAVLIAFIPPIFISSFVLKEWVYKALIFLVISCPCALVISIPLTFFCGIGCASKNGILIKGSNYIEALASAATVVFDKTGTLTKGTFSVTKVKPVGMDRDKFLELAAHAEIYSPHPIALSIKRAYDREVLESKVKDVKELAGYGVKANVNGSEIYLGNKKLMDEIGVECANVKPVGTVNYMSVNGKFAGYMVISDKIKDDTKTAIRGLRKIGIEKIAMLTGDAKIISETLSSDLNLDYVASELLPMDKLKELNLLLEKTDDDGTLIFAGDGINDAPVLAGADIGVAMGALGADAAVETADVVVMDDKPSKIVDAIVISKNTVKITKQNIIFSLGVKFAILLLGFFGLASMWSAVFADVGVSVIAIINSLRALSYRKKEY